MSGVGLGSGLGWWTTAAAVVVRCGQRFLKVKDGFCVENVGRWSCFIVFLAGGMDGWMEEVV